VNKDLAIVVSSGTLKGVYGQGVLSALEERCITPAAWGCASSSVDLKTFGVDYLRASAEGVIKAYETGYNDGVAAIERDKVFSLTDH
jgi:hypothetical protein